MTSISPTWATYVRVIAGDVRNTTIAELVGTTDSTVSRWMSGKINPRPREAVAFARAFGANKLFALRAAGYLDESDGIDFGEAPRGIQLASFTKQEIAEELLRRIQAEADAAAAI